MDKFFTFHNYLGGWYMQLAEQLGAAGVGGAGGRWSIRSTYGTRITGRRWT